MHQHRQLVTLLVGILLLPILPGADVYADPGEDGPDRSTHQLSFSVIGMAGSPGVSETYRTNGTLGQSTPVGLGVSNDYELSAGFWRRLYYYLPVEEPVIGRIFRNALYQNLPNPFRVSTAIRYRVGHISPVELSLHDVSGRRIRTLIRDQFEPGEYTIIWDGKDDSGAETAAGVYFYKFKTDSYSAVRKMMVLK
ncbi:T9SS type A sorting domain-containing protein [Candidatus Eisenbacteria bacterium]|uniref:T9SS type A sorting domain-containing protein n=1 Tax=Eiseniibacteriota bacterium TaxID=2212470 RepID=A0ABV6YLY1_UNCEI